MRNDRKPTGRLEGYFSYARCTTCDGGCYVGSPTGLLRCADCGGRGVIITEHTSDGKEAKCQKVEARSQQ